MISGNGHSPYEKMKRLQRAIAEKLETLNPELPELPEPDTEPNDEGWLFDSRRDYLEQIHHYKAR